MLPLPRVPLAFAAVVAASCLAGALAASFVYPAYAQDPPSCPSATPTAVPVTAVPIVVASTTADYFVLYVRPNLKADFKIPISVTLGEEGATTLTEQLSPLPKEHYLVEKYSIDDPADIDRDCFSDIDELADLGALNPINMLPEIDSRHGTVAIPDRETFERLSYQGTEVLIDNHLTDLEFVKFFIFHLNAFPPAVYFMNTETHRAHFSFSRAVKHPRGGIARGEIVYHPDVEAPDGSLGVYRFEFEPWDAYPFEAVKYAYEVLAASMPFLENNLAYYPMPAAALPLYQEERASYEDSRVNVVFEADIFPDVDFLSLNRGTGYGYLRVMGQDERPNPRDIVLYPSLPNDLPRVAGIITTVPQTPLSHVNLRALQDRVPNAFVRDALDNATIDSLLDSHVQYTVTRTGFTIRAATKAEVDAHYDVSRPAAPQTPERDLSVTAVTPLSDVEFGDWTAFGVKAANVAVLGTLDFPDGTVPDGFAIPFYFYDEFMKANGLYTNVSTMLADSEFQTDYDTQEDKLKELRNAIKNATTPDWIITALEEMHAEFPDGASLRYRSSTNNEDLPGFSGAGLYDSKTQDPEETEEDGIDKSIKRVWASLWNFRAFVERDFHRVDHLTTAMGVLVHPNYSDELANGVAVSHDPIGGREGAYYVNTQVGEDLVTNPEENSVPEELLLQSGGSYEVLVYSNRVEPEELLMSDVQLEQLRRHLQTIHEGFKDLYDPAADERFAMEIEFKITSEDVLAIKQARPWVFRPLNEPPEFPSTDTGVRRVAEGAPLDTKFGAPVAATDAEGDVLTYSLSGPDAGFFLIVPETGVLMVWTDLDYETRATYSVTVEVHDGRDSKGQPNRSRDDWVAVNIQLTNKDEAGTLTLSAERPYAGTPLTAALSDPDEVVSLTWTWERSTSRNGPWSAVTSAIARVTTSVYTPVAGDVGYYLRVTAAYTDGHGPHKSRVLVSANSVKAAPTVNVPPSFDDRAPTRSIPENARARATVGRPVTATDTNNGDVLTYELSGSDLFTIDSNSGQIRVAADESLDHEEAPSHSVTVKASDTSNAFDTVTVTITVDDVNEPPEATDDTETTNEDESLTFNVLGNDQDPENDDLTVRLSRGPRNGSATLDPNSYEITYTPNPDYHGADTLTYVLTDGDGLTDTGEVALDVRPVNDPPAFPSGPVAREVARDAREGDRVGSPVTASDVDQDDRLTYSLIAGFPFAVELTTGQIVVATGAPPFDQSAQDSYTVTVVAQDQEDVRKEIEVTINVVEQLTSRSTTGGGGGGGFGPAPVAPKFSDGFRTKRELPENAKHSDPIGEPVSATHPDDLEVTYSLSGADAQNFVVDEETGQLRIKDGMTPAMGNSYTVNLTATDSAGVGAIIIVVINVTEASHHRFDLDQDGNIERVEVVAAVKDYFDGLISKDDVIELVKMYFAESG